MKHIIVLIFLALSPLVSSAQITLKFIGVLSFFSDSLIIQNCSKCNIKDTIDRSASSLFYIDSTCTFYIQSMCSYGNNIPDIWDLSSLPLSTQLIYVTLPYDSVIGLESIGRYKNLKVLAGMEVSDSKFPKSITNCKELESLDYYTVNKWFPKELWELNELKYLSIVIEKQKKIPNKILELNKLQGLNICMPRLKEFPEMLFELKNLEELLLYSNGKLKIPDDIYKMENLRKIRIKIDFLDSTSISNLAKLPKLEEIFFYGINEKPLDLKKYTFLKQLANSKSLKTINFEANKYSFEYEIIFKAYLKNIMVW